MTFCVFIPEKNSHYRDGLKKAPTHEMLDISYQPALQHFAIMGAIMEMVQFCLEESFLRKCLKSSINRASKNFCTPGATCTLLFNMHFGMSIMMRMKIVISFILDIVFFFQLWQTAY